MLDRLWFILGLVCLIYAHPCEQDEESTRIVGGGNVTIYNFPWQVSLLNASNNQHVCGGVLISRYAVLTAAHCVRFNRVKQVRIGSASRVRGGYTRRVHRLIIHPNFNQTTFDNDIAILTFRKRIYFSRRVQAVVLPNSRQELVNNATLTVSGWGSTNPNNRNLTNVLHAVDVQVIAQRTCAASNNRLTDNMFCAGNFNAGGVGPCTGDEGGPAVNRSEPGPVIQGLVSSTNNCARPRSPAVYTRVSRYTDWIHRNLLNN